MLGFFSIYITINDIIIILFLPEHDCFFVCFLRISPEDQFISSSEAFDRIILVMDFTMFKSKVR